jgi:hypothetical protein
MEVISFVPSCFTTGLMLLISFKQKAVWAPETVLTIAPPRNPTTVPQTVGQPNRVRIIALSSQHQDTSFYTRSTHLQQKAGTLLYKCKDF